MTFRPVILAVALGAVCGCLVFASAAGAAYAPKGGAKMRMAPKRGPAGTTFKAAASGFARGEPLLASEHGRGRRASRLPGGSATRRGRVLLLRRTFVSSKPGPRRLCVRGERSGRRACARYRLTPGGEQPADEELGLEEGEELFPPESEEGEEEELEFVEDDDLFELDDGLELPGVS